MVTECMFRCRKVLVAADGCATGLAGVLGETRDLCRTMRDEQICGDLPRRRGQLDIAGDNGMNNEHSARGENEVW